MAPLWRAAAAAGRRLGRPRSVTAAATIRGRRRTVASSSYASAGFGSSMVVFWFFIQCTGMSNDLSDIKEEIKGLRQDMKKDGTQSTGESDRSVVVQDPPPPPGIAA